MLEHERENFSNFGDISDADVKSNASSLNFGKRVSGVENSRDHSKDRADKWVVETALDMNTNRNELGRIKMEKETVELKFLVQNTSTSWRPDRSSDSRFGERGEVEGFRRNPRTDVGGMRYSYPTFPDEGPSDYAYGEPLIRNRRMDVGGGIRHSYYGYGEPSRNGGSSLDGGDRVEYFGHDQTRLVRQLDELKDRFNRSCDITEKPQEKVPLDRRMFHEEAYEDSEAWFPASSSSSGRSSMPYFKHYADQFPYNTRHEKGMHHSYPFIHDSNHNIPGYEDGFGAQMLRQRRSPGQAPARYQQQPPHAYFSGGYMEPDSGPYEPYPRNPNLHHPSCSCFRCYSRHQEVPGSIPPNAFLNRRFPDIPNDPMLYHRQENPVPFGTRGYNPGTANPPMRTSHDSHSHTRMPIDLNSQSSDFVRHLPPKEALLNGRRYCCPLAGGAPFITCCNCIELLVIPKKILLAKTKQQKIQCGACSTIIFLAVDGHKIVASIHEETEKTSKEIDNGAYQLVDECPSNSHGQVNNQYSENFSSDDYDKSAYDFQSMDAQAGSVQTEGTEPERLQNLHSSPRTPENDGSQEGLIAPRVEDNHNLLEQPKKSVLSPLPPGSTLQQLFDYSSNNFQLNHFQNGNQSKRSDHEKVMSPKAVSQQSSVKDVSMATEMEVSFNEFSNTGVSQDSGDASREHDLGINKRGERFLAGIVREDFRDSSSPSRTIKQGIVMVNGHLIPDHLVKKAEKLAGTIQPGEYW